MGKTIKGFRKIEGMSDEEGNVFLVKRNIFGKIVDKVGIDMRVSKINFLKSICVSCGREYVVLTIEFMDMMPIVSETKDISYNGFVFAKFLMKPCRKL